MSIYKPRKLRPLHLAAMTVRALIQLLQVWPLVLMAAVLISPVGPNLRYKYAYQQRGDERYMISCTYLGSRGFVQYSNYGECPLFVVLDNRTGEKIYSISQIL